MGYDCIEEIKKAIKLLDEFNLMSASTREVLNVCELLNARSHILTVVPRLLYGLLVHPYTKENENYFIRCQKAIIALMDKYSLIFSCLMGSSAICLDYCSPC